MILRLALGGRQQRSRDQRTPRAGVSPYLVHTHQLPFSSWSHIEPFRGCCELRDDSFVVVLIKEVVQYIVRQQKQDMEEGKEGMSDHSQTAHSYLFLVQT